MSLCDGYQTDGFYDEMYSPDGKPRPHYESLFRTLSAMSGDEFRVRRELAELTLINQGITFTVYGDERGVEKPFPLDLIPRIVPAHEWSVIERGLMQRVEALNLFLDDVYHEGKILRDHVIPRDLVVNAAHFRREFVGAEVPGNRSIHSG
jgi:uncharacterized circularly permuted ATP-grasp superfamily protein